MQRYIHTDHPTNRRVHQSTRKNDGKNNLHWIAMNYCFGGLCGFGGGEAGLGFTGLEMGQFVLPPMIVSG